MTERNALAELAERLEVEAKFAQENGRNGRPIYNASRIVSELAKIEDFDSTKQTLAEYAMYLSKFIGTVRVIAEEGAGYGR